MQAHDDDGDAGDLREDVRIDADQAADGAGAGAERDKDGGEAEHEQQRADHGFAPHRGSGSASAKRSSDRPER